MFRLTALALIVLFALICVQGAHVCKEKDCSDVVGEAMVKDNLGNSKHFDEKHHAQWKEEARKHRVEIKKREQDLQ